MRAPSFTVPPDRKLRLADVGTDDTRPFRDKAEARAATAKNLERLAELQERLYAGQRRALLVVLQGMDTSGKDGAIRKVFSGINPQGCSVVSFKAPTPLELAHDYLWRIHQHAPPRGMIAIFNRSHYESVLVERVHELVPRKVWSARYEQINAFEAMLHAEGTAVLKFFLHVSRAEQKRRLEARLRDPAKHWKFNPADLKERERWDEYQAAYADALRKCSTAHAPWHVIPADHKWYRDWAISRTIVQRLEEVDPQYPPPPEGIEAYRVPD